MKNSGIEWIGEIPENWDCIKNKFLAFIYTGNSIKDEEKNKYEDPNNSIPYIATKNIIVDNSKIDTSDILFIKKNDTSFLRAHKGDTLMCIEGGSAGKKKTYLNYDVCFVNKLCCFHPFKIHNKFLFYILSSPHYEEEFLFNLTGLIGGVSVNKLKNFSLPYPPIDEQQKIADYLDKRCENIDGLVELQNRMIEKLKEYKQSVITEAVTKGLNSAAKMKNSGVEWIGEIPENWEVKRLKNICKLYPTILTDKTKFEIISYAPMDCVGNGVLKHKEIDVQSIPTGLNYFEDNDILMAKVTPCFENGNIVIAKNLKNGVGVGSSELFVLRVNCVNVKWLFYFLQNVKFKDMAKSTMTGTGGLKRVSPLFISSFELPCPPIDEQQKITDYLDERCAEIDRLIEIKQKKIEKLQDYKKSLIYECVTGKREIS